jgi:uncharacterized PurR-regulated membrane protein YhhQ (DUF165 family)
MIVLYLLSIAAANVLTAKYNPIPLHGGAILLPAGSFLAGATFVLRDLVQTKHGRKTAYHAIFGAFILSIALSMALGDTAFVSLASLLAFVVSETADTEIFSRSKRSFVWRVLASGIIGGTIDSVIFVLTGLSPLTSGVLTWGQVPFAVIGQMAAKAVVQLLAGAVLMKINRNKRGGRP